MQKQLSEKNEMHLVDKINAAAMQQLAEEFMLGDDQQRKHEGGVIK